MDHLLPIIVVLGLAIIAWRFEQGSKDKRP